ncbi:hypothetical protein ACLM5H_25410 [Fredinandcohnia humi]
MSYEEYWDRIYTHSEKMNALIGSYWREYSDMGNWQFWVVVFLLVSPLILLYFTVDRTKIFQLFFFGYTVHILWAYIDIILERYNYFVHTYFIAPAFPFALSMTSSALPVGYLLLYQYCINHKKNFFLYSLFLGAMFSFVFGGIEIYLGLAKLGKGMKLIYVFLIDTGIAYISYFFTEILARWKITKRLS